MSKIPSSDEATKELSEYDPQIKTIIAAANALKVTNEEESQHAAKFLGDLKSETDRLESKRKELTVGLNATLKVINNGAKVRSEPLKQADKIVKAKLGTYLDEQARIAEEAAAKVRDEQEAAEKKAMAKAAAAKKAGDDEAAKKATEEAEEIKKCGARGRSCSNISANRCGACK